MSSSSLEAVEIKGGCGISRGNSELSREWKSQTKKICGARFHKREKVEDHPLFEKVLRTRRFVRNLENSQLLKKSKLPIHIVMPPGLVSYREQIKLLRWQSRVVEEDFRMDNFVWQSLCSVDQNGAQSFSGGLTLPWIAKDIETKMLLPKVEEECEKSRELHESFSDRKLDEYIRALESKGRMPAPLEVLISYLFFTYSPDRMEQKRFLCFGTTYYQGFPPGFPLYIEFKLGKAHFGYCNWLDIKSTATDYVTLSCLKENLEFE